MTDHLYKLVHIIVFHIAISCYLLRVGALHKELKLNLRFAGTSSRSDFSLQKLRCFWAIVMMPTVRILWSMLIIHCYLEKLSQNCFFNHTIPTCRTPMFRVNDRIIFVLGQTLGNFSKPVATGNNCFTKIAHIFRLFFKGVKNLSFF